MFLIKGEYLMGTTGGGDVSNRFNVNGRSTCFCIKNDGITWRTTNHGVMMRNVWGNVIAWCRTERALLSIV